MFTAHQEAWASFIHFLIAYIGLIQLYLKIKVYVIYVDQHF